MDMRSRLDIGKKLPKRNAISVQRPEIPGSRLTVYRRKVWARDVLKGMDCEKSRPSVDAQKLSTSAAYCCCYYTQNFLDATDNVIGACKNAQPRMQSHCICRNDKANAKLVAKCAL